MSVAQMQATIQMMRLRVRQRRARWRSHEHAADDGRQARRKRPGRRQQRRGAARQAGPIPTIMQRRGQRGATRGRCHREHAAMPDRRQQQRPQDGQPPTRITQHAGPDTAWNARCRGRRAADGSAISPLAPWNSRNRLVQMLLAEIRPQRVDEHQLGVGALPEQEIADALLAAGADQQVRVGHARRQQLAARSAPRRCRRPRARRPRRGAPGCGPLAGSRRARRS